jgi:hypothetical protein
MFTFVTVTHSVDEEALCFQARSMAPISARVYGIGFLVVDNSEASKTLNHTKVVAHYVKTSVSFLSMRRTISFSRWNENSSKPKTVSWFRIMGTFPSTRSTTVYGVFSSISTYLQHI